MTTTSEPDNQLCAIKSSEQMISGSSLLQVNLIIVYESRYDDENDHDNDDTDIWWPAFR